MSSSNNGTKTIESWQFNRPHPWLGGIFLIGAVLRLWHLGYSSLWENEIVRVFVATRKDLPTLLDSIGDFSPTPPLDFLVMRSFLKVLGQGDYVVRLPAALWGILSIWLIYALGRRLFGWRTGLIAAFLLAISPFHIQYSQEAGPHSAFLGLTCLSVLWFHKALQENSLGAWIGYTTFTALALYTHYFSLILILVQVLYLAWIWWESHTSLRLKVSIARRKVAKEEGTETSLRWQIPFTVAVNVDQGPGSGWINRRVPWNLLLSGVCILALYVPWLLFGLYYFGPRTSGPTLTQSLLAEILAALSGGHGLPRVVYLACLIGASLASWKAQRRELILLLLWLILSVPMAVVALRWADLSLDMGSLIFLLPAYLVLVSRGLQGVYNWASKFTTRITRRPEQISNVVILTILMLFSVLLSSFPLLGYYRSEKANWRALAAFLDAHVSPDHAVVFYHPDHEPAWQEISLRLYLSNDDVYMLSIEDPAVELEDLWETHRGLWFIDRGFSATYQVRRQLAELETPVVHFIFGKNDGHELAQRIAPPAFGDIQVLYVSHRFRPNDTAVDEVRRILFEMDEQTIRQEFTLAEMIRQYGSKRSDSLALYDEALRDAPDYLAVYIHVLKGNMHRNQGVIKAAIDDYLAAIALNPKSAMAHYGLALAYERRGQRVLAINEWVAFLRLEPAGERADTARQHLQRLRK